MTDQGTQPIGGSRVSRQHETFDRKTYERRHRPPIQRPPLTYPQILAWADAHHARSGKWPTVHSGGVLESPRENWNAISVALDKGYRGLPGGLTLAQFLAVARGVRNKVEPRRLGVRQILRWAEAHNGRHGTWPVRMSGAIPNSGGETWAGVDIALSRGTRGFPGGSSLRQFLTEWRGASIEFPQKPETKLTVAQILLWADEHFTRHRRWPVSRSSRRPKLDETWRNINLALIHGSRGLPGGSSLARLLEEHRTRAASG